MSKRKAEVTWPIPNPALEKYVVSTTLRLLCSRERPCTHCKGDCVTSGPVWTARKISPLLGFDPRIVQLVARRYTDRAIQFCRRLRHFWKKKFRLSLPIKYSVGISEVAFNTSLPESSRFRVSNANIISTSDLQKRSWYLIMTVYPWAKSRSIRISFAP
jgi:hypothetical protein